MGVTQNIESLTQDCVPGCVDHIHVGVEDKDKDGALATYKFGELETNKHLQLEYGNVTKTFKMDYVSNAEFSQVCMGRGIVAHSCCMLKMF